MATKLPGTNNDGASLKSDTFAGGDIVAFKINLGAATMDDGLVTPVNPFPTIDAAASFAGVGQIANISTAAPTRIPANSNVRAVTIKALNSNTGTV